MTSTLWQSDYAGAQSQAGIGYPVTSGDLLPGNMLWKVPNLLRIRPLYRIEVTGDLWHGVTSMKVALKTPRGWDGCMYQIRLVLRRQMKPSPFQKGFLFLALSNGLKIYRSNWHKNNLSAIKINKSKFVVRLLMSGILTATFL